MPSSGYNAVSFTFGEQPTATKWNYLGSNDAAFKTGAGFDDNIIITRHLDTFIGTGWFDKSGESWSYSSVDGPTGVITVPSDYTTKAAVGMRVRLTQSATVKYFIITALTATTMTVYGGTDYTLANAAISAMSISPFKAPLGFPLSPTKWTLELTDTSSRVQSSPSNGTLYNTGSLSLAIHIGAWRVYAEATIDPSSSAGVGDAQWGISTANNSVSDVQMLEYIVVNTRSARKVHIEKNLLLASKTTYYIIMGTLGGSWSDIVMRNNTGALVFRAVCAYL